MLDEWYDFVDYTVEFFVLFLRSYRVIWYKFFYFFIVLYRWNNILFLIRLLFCLFVFNVIVERFFGSLKRVKIGKRVVIG